MQHIIDVVLLAMVFLWFPVGVFTFKFVTFFLISMKKVNLKRLCNENY